MPNSKGATTKWLVGLTVLAFLITLLGIAVVWAVSYGPLG